jgi:hypothetical protein
LLVSRAFADAGADVLMITNIDPLVGDADHEDVMKSYKGFPNTYLLPIESAKPAHTDLVICGFRPAWSDRMPVLYDPWLEKSDKLALVYKNAKGEAPLRLTTEVKMLSRWPSLFRTSRFTTDDFPPHSSLFSLFARGTYFGLTLRQWALCDESLREPLMRSFDPMAPRQHILLSIVRFRYSSDSHTNSEVRPRN